MPEQSSPLKEWALVVYMCANVPGQEMHDAARANLEQMATLGSTDKVWVAAQLACPGPSTYQYIFPEHPPGSPATVVEPFKTIASINSALPSSLEQFIAWATLNCPAKKIMLVLWGHGYGVDYYDPGAMMKLAVDGRMLPMQSISTHSGGFEYADAFSGFTTWVPTRFGWDAASSSVLDNGQIGAALRVCVNKLPKEQTLAIVGFDACVMAMAEVWCEMKGTAAIGIASEASLPFLSWPYDAFLEMLTDAPEAEPRDVAKMLSEAFLQQYSSHPRDYVAISACDLTQVAAFENVFRPLAQALSDASSDPGSRANIFEARKYCPAYDEQGFIDLGCFCRFLQITMPKSPVDDACKAVLDALPNFVIRSVYSPQNPELTLALSTGVSVWLPPWIQDPNAYAIQKTLAEAYLDKGYLETEFALSTGWAKFLSNLRTQAWGTIGQAQTRTGGGNDAVHKGGKTMSTGHMGDEKMGEEKMGDEKMGADGSRAQKIFGSVSPGAAGIVLRASIESFGPAGDAELNLTVKWPAAILSAAEMLTASPAQTSQTRNTSDQAGNATSPTLSSRARNPQGPVQPTHSASDKTHPAQ